MCVCVCVCARGHNRTDTTFWSHCAGSCEHRPYAFLLVSPIRCSSLCLLRSPSSLLSGSVVYGALGLRRLSSRGCSEGEGEIVWLPSGLMPVILVTSAWCKTCKLQKYIQLTHFLFIFFLLLPSGVEKTFFFFLPFFFALSTGVGALLDASSVNWKLLHISWQLATDVTIWTSGTKWCSYDMDWSYQW